MTFGVLILAAVAAEAQEPSAASASVPATSVAPASATPAAQSAATTPAPSVAPVRRDPLGVRGISPQMEAILAGDAAVLARDFADARVKYTDAAKLAPKDPLPHLRLAELHLLEKRPTDAEASIVNVLRYAGQRLDLEARARFLRALVQELERNLVAADHGWDEYIALADTGGSSSAGATTPASSEPSAAPTAAPAAQPASGGPTHAARVYVNSATERKKAIQAAQKAKAEGEAVGARLTKEIQAADQARAAAP